MKSTNYYNTFIAVAADCPAKTAEIPPLKKTGKSIAVIQFETLIENPYRFTSDTVLFNIYAAKNNIQREDSEQEREHYFSKGQACFRCSPLPKRYGWGVHCNEEGKMAIYGIETEAYQKLATDDSLHHTKAMRSGKK